MVALNLCRPFEIDASGIDYLFVWILVPYTILMAESVAAYGGFHLHIFYE